MKRTISSHLLPACCCLLACFALARPLPAQTLINLDFGAGGGPVKTGFAATGIGTNDAWNIYRHYEPKFVPGMPPVPNGRMEKLRFADGSESAVCVAVTNAPGVWGNTSGDAMYDSYMFAPNGSNIVVTLTGLPPGRYQFYVYGHADADVSGEQNSVFTLKSGTNTFGPVRQLGGGKWKAGNPWQEGLDYVAFREVGVDGPVVLEAAPGPNGIAVLNGLQIISRGTSPPRLLVTSPAHAAPASTNLLFGDLRYEGRVSENEARFTVTFKAESMTTNEIAAPLFEGEVALVAPQLPEGLRIARNGSQTRLFCSVPGVHLVKLDLVARITRAEPWNQISFSGPATPIATVTAAAVLSGVEMQLLSGTQLSQGSDTNRARIEGFLGPDGLLSLRWQSKGAEVARRSLVTVDTAATIQVTPTVIKYNTSLRYEILQAPIPSLMIELPPAHALTKIQGEQIRDWQVKTENGRQLLSVEFIKPVEKACALTLFSEQTLESGGGSLSLLIPQPLEVGRESGSLTLSADDATIEIESTPGLRQVNAPAGALAGYRFNTRPVSVLARVQRIEPVIKVTDRLTTRLEETRTLAAHVLDVTVEKAGIYSLDLVPQRGFVVTEVKGEGLDDWKTVEGNLRISFAARVLGTRKLHIQLEQAHKEFPNAITILPLGIRGATNITTQLGAASSPGIRLKTGQLSGLREVPISLLPARTDELLAFVSEQAGWTLSLDAERLAPRVVAEVFNLITIGDGLVGGSATVRYGILNQGVQAFRVALPAHWKNVEFTGANIRRKEQQTNVWTITLQDKAWGGYTLVITYDYQFDPKGAAINLAGAHALDVERETGSVGLMTAASLQLTPGAPAEPLRRVDEAELSATDRALCTRPLLLAYRYTGNDYRLSVQVTRFEEVAVLDAVADRTELTTVLTEEGQLLTQSSFMVKNNEKQFQKFKLPKEAKFWSSYVNGRPAKPERDGEWYLVPLPRDANRDQAFAVEIVYAEQIDLKKSLFPRRMTLSAPVTDIPNTYAEWQLFVPASQRLSNFGGNMTVASGTTYRLQDAWQQFLGFYGNLIEHHAGQILFGCVVALILVLIAAALRRGARGAVTVIAVFAIFAVLAAMLLPALSKAKSKAQRISAVNNLKQVGLAAKIWATENGSMMPPNFEAMKNELGSDKVLVDPGTGQRFVYVGTGKSDANPEAILAYSPSDVNGRAVLFADGSVQIMNQEKFDQAMQQDAALPRAIISANMPVALQGVPQSTSTITRRLAEAAATPAPAMEAVTGLPMEGLADKILAVDGSGGGAQMPAVLGKPTAAGVRPIRIEIPRAGQAFSFTKVLNATSEPLGVSVSMMRLKVYRTLQMVLQVCAFGFGLLLLWALILLRSRRTFWMTVAVGLVLWSVTSLLTMWRVLHVGFIVLVPAIPLALIVWFGWRRWKGRKVEQAEPPPPIETGGGPAAQAGLPLILAFALLSAAGGSVAQAQGAAALPDAVSITAASYTGSVGDKVAQFEAVIEMSSTATNALAVPLFGEEIAIESFTADSGARLVREGRNIHVLLQPQSTVRLALRLAVRLGGDITRRHLLFKIPPALSSRVDLVIQEADADVEFPTAVAFDRTSAGQQTRVQAFIGAADRLELNWTPRVKRAAEIAATVFVQNAALVQLGGGVLNTRATLDFQVSQGELRQIRVQVPPEQRVLRVEGESIRIWEVREDTLVVDLLKGVSPGYKLTVETEKLLEKLPALAQIEIPHALDVKRETGFVALRGSEELSVTIEDARELQRVDAEEFQRVAPGEHGALLSAFRFLKTDFTLQVRAENVQPQIEATVINQVRVDPESVRLSAQVAYTIKRAGVFGLRLGLPAGYRLDSVTGANVSQWVERDDEGARTLEVTLMERTIGAYGLQVVLSRNFRAAPPSLLIEGVHPRGIEKLTGFILLSTEHGLALKTQSLDALTEIPFTDAGLVAASRQAAITPTGALAYKFISPAPDAVPTWRLTVATEAVEPWVRAEVFNTITVAETLVSGRTVIQYDIANAPVREFRLRVPSAFKNIEITGAQIRRRDQTNDQWRVELQSKVRGAYLLTVTWELAKTAETRLIEFTGIEALAIERETGFIAVVARPPLLVTEKASTELLTRIDTRELPEWAGRVDTATVLAYRYLRPGYKLALEAKRFQEAEVLQALVDNARLTTVVADDGQVMTEVSLAIRNNGRQHLEVELPAGSTVWSTFIAGQPVRPSKQQGKLLLPLAREIGSDAPVAVELTFIGTNVFPKHRGQVALVSPRFDIPMKNARWDLYLPPDYEYGKFEGSMTRTSDAAAPMVQVYSLSEYNQQQRVQEEQQVTELKSGLKAARDNLSGGNLREALGSYNRAKARFFSGGERDKDLQAVEQDLRRAQSSNLIVAQNNYYFENAGKLGEQSMPGQSGPQQIAKGKAEATVAMNYDEGVAGQQWDKLERAQQIAVAKVAPLRVNLPTRGVHYTFSQVLQTEERKPMTIRLVAESTKAPSWTSRILLSLAGFVTLWGMVAVANHRRLRATEPRPS